MIGIELQILWWDEGQSQLNELGVRPDVTEANTRPVTFYRIDNISPYYEGDNEFTALRSGGTEYICPQRYNETKRLLSLMDILK